MSTVSTVRPSSKSHVDWWFARLGTGGSQPRETVITEMIGPLVREARSHGLVRWSFTWHENAARTSLMLALLGNARVGQLIPEGWTAAEERRDTTVSWPQGGQDARPASSDLAEIFEELSCDLAVWAAQDLPRETSRAALGALLLHDAAHTLLSAPLAPEDPHRRARAWREYWDRHEAVWGHRKDSVAPTLLALDLSALETYSLEPEIADLRADPTVDYWRHRWSRGLERLLSRSRDLDLPTSPIRLTLIHSHLILNRLGFLPHEEARLGEVARSLRAESIPALGVPVPMGGEYHAHSH